jgi:hydrogenase nickel incorporation protein HypA/HybF
MHELAVSLALIDHAERIAREHGARRIARLRVLVGPLSGIEGELLARSYGIARAGTLTSEAILEWTPSAISVCCQECGATSAATMQRLLCGSCGSWRTHLVTGDELTLQSVELVDATH